MSAGVRGAAGDLHGAERMRLAAEEPGSEMPGHGLAQPRRGLDRDGVGIEKRGKAEAMR